MRVTVIRSGSSNNCTLIETETKKILIDIGVSKKLLEAELETLNLKLTDIDDLFITHTHGDHISGLSPFYKASKASVWLTEACFLEICTEKKYEGLIKSDRIKPILKDDTYKVIKLGDIVITPLELYHDKPETIGFVIEEEIKYTQITDTGLITEDTIKKAQNSDIINLETNYDLEMLENSNRRESLIERIKSDNGHLENEQSFKYLKEMIGENTKHVIHSHISSECNAKQKIEKARKLHIKNKDIEFHFASKTKKLVIELCK